ncbi:hypothetical protein FDZ74_00015 [bacterium]|nr:MAG: hypothetical protein FDZ74_00015 [bacterium]
MSSSRQVHREIWISAGLILLVSALAYLPLVGQLGLYRDDWFPTVAFTSGISLTKLHEIDRPVVGLWFRFIAHFLGDAPLTWHLFAFAVRSAGSLVFFWLLRMVWSRQKTATLLMALLFAVYPGFLQQTNATNYQNHLVALLFGLSSILLTLLALRATNRIWQIAGIFFSVAFDVIGVGLYETLFGLEVLRFAFVYLHLSHAGQPSRNAAIRRALLKVLPNWLAVGAFLFWRLFIFTSLRSSLGGETLFAGLLSNPPDAVVRVILGTLGDLLDTAIFAWGVPLYKLTLNSSALDLAVTLALVAAACAVTWLVLIRLARKEATIQNGEDDERTWIRETLWIGGISLILTTALVSLTGRDVNYEFNYDRFTLQSMAGTAMLTVGILFLVRPPARTVLALGLIGLSVATHYNNAVYYRDFWQAQRSFWWQTTWRAPGIEEDTVLMALLPDGSRFAEGYETWAPANLIYSDKFGATPIHAEVLNKDTLSWVQSQDVVDLWWRTGIRTNNFHNLLVASMPTLDGCVHWIDGSDVEITNADDLLIREAAPYSDIDRIQTGAASVVPPQNIFGTEPEHGWCYYYQKAELARQEKDWAEVEQLFSEASAAGLEPGEAIEWLPFYEARYALGMSGEAEALAERIRADQTGWQLYCRVNSSLLDNQNAGSNPAIAALCE